MDDLYQSWWTAIKTNNIEKVIELLRNNRICHDYEDGFGNDGLMKASELGYLDLVASLISEGVDKNSESKNGTALMCASERDHLPVVEFLIQEGCEVNLADSYGWTALMNASYYGHLEIVQFLLNAGAEVHHKNKKGNTALVHAVMGDSEDIVMTLLQAGADINHLFSMEERLTSLFTSKPLTEYIGNHLHNLSLENLEVWKKNRLKGLFE